MASMTRKHFVHMADVLKNMKPEDRNKETKREYKKRLMVWENTCKEMAYFCSAYNYSFNKSTFMSACGVGEDE